MSKRLNVLGKNTASNFIFFFVSKGLSLFNYAILIRLLGLDSYGLLLFTASVLGQLNFMSGGLGTALEKFIPEYRAKGKFKKLNNSFTVTLLLFIGIGFLLSLLLLVVAYTDLITFFDISNIEKGKTLLILAAIFAPISWAGNCLKSTLRGYNDHHYLNKIETTTYSLSVFVSIVLAYFNFDLVWIFLSQRMSVVINTFLFVKKISKDYKITFKIKGIKILLNTLKEIFSYSVWVFLIEISSFIVNTFDKIIVSGALGVKALPIYMGIIKMIQILASVNSKLNSAVIPIASELFQKESIQKFNEAALRGVRAVNAISSPISVLMIVFAFPILKIIGKDILTDYIVIFQIGTIIYMIGGSKSFLQKMIIGSGITIKEIGVIGITTSILYLGLIHYSISLFYINGAILTLPVIHLVILPLWFYLVAIPAKIKIDNFFKSVFKGQWVSWVFLVSHLIIYWTMIETGQINSSIYYLTYIIIVLPLYGFLTINYAFEKKIRALLISNVPYISTFIVKYKL